ncbi:response regulator [Halovulum dunhuangense]|uniref:Response regulator n=1 Tax=Halovulum dunhuangense TaxID=1505036 RepID=A0A849L547_9RHOB|nr:response regulator [Halovulum dunhuangense]NNU81383.1 response regulator [Halovulum dunhuangense]
MNAPLILCVEDEPSLREDIAVDLREAGYAVIAAATAVDALDLLDGKRPDLILSDIVMPEMDGHALLAHLRAARPDLDDIPFVFLTALSAREQMIAGRRAGADDYLTKPIDYDLLRAIVSNCLDRARRARSAANLRSGIAALDRLSVGVVLLDGKGDVQYANGSAQERARAAGIDIGTRVTAKGEQGRKLAELVGALVAGNESGGAFSVYSGARRLMVLGRSLRSGSAPGGAAAMLMLSDPERQRPLDPRTLRQLFDLTPTEADVARLVAEGLRRNQIASRLGLSPTTIAFHLRNIFEKTGTHRQADLVALFLSMPISGARP